MVCTCGARSFPSGWCCTFSFNDFSRFQSASHHCPSAPHLHFTYSLELDISTLRTDAMSSSERIESQQTTFVIPGHFSSLWLEILSRDSISSRGYRIWIRDSSRYCHAQSWPTCQVTTKTAFSDRKRGLECLFYGPWFQGVSLNYHNKIGRAEKCHSICTWPHCIRASFTATLAYLVFKFSVTTYSTRWSLFVDHSD